MAAGGPVPTVPTFLTGVPSTAILNQLAQAVSFALNPPLAVLAQAVTAQSISNNLWTPVTLDASIVDQNPAVPTTPGHSTSVNPSRYTALYPGWYLGNAAAAWALSSAGSRGGRWAVNGTPLNQCGTLLPTVAASFGAQVGPPGQLFYLNQFDYVEYQIYQNSGGSLLTTITAAAMPGVSIAWYSN